MDWQPFSKTQKRAVRESKARINTYDGPVRSGKTTAQRFAWCSHIKEAPHPNLLITGQTKDTIRRNVLFDLFDLFDVCRVPYAYNQSEGTVRALGTTMHIVGANDEKAESRLRGLTIGGWLGDEVNLAPESFVKMALTRMSMAGARAFWTMNPDSPFHYLYTDFLTNEALIEAGILKRIIFSLDDNLSLDEEFKAALRALYAPGSLFYRRFILGEWVVAEGAIYDMLDVEPGGAHVVANNPERYERVVVGIDYGTANPTVFLAAGKDGKTWTVFSEHRYSGTETGRQRTDAEHSAAYLRWIGSLGVSPSSVEVDPSAASFKVQLRQDGVRGVRDADHAVIDGIRVVSTGLTSGTLKIHESCETLLSEMSTYSWDEKAQKKGEDKPLKVNDHGPDALRYLSMRVLNRPALSVVKKPVGL